MKTLKVIVYADPGHAWAAVKKHVLVSLGIADKITPYSYQRGGTAYLEEDRDLSTLIGAARAADITLTFDERHTDKRSPIRSYERYTG